MLKLLLGLTLLFLASAGAEGQGRGPEETKVFYFELLTNTSTPIDVSSIEERHDLTSVVRGIMPEILRVLSVQELPYTEIGYHNVRLKLVVPGREDVVLDLNGNVSGLGKPHALRVASRRRLMKLIASALPDDLTRPFPGG